MRAAGKIGKRGGRSRGEREGGREYVLTLQTFSPLVGPLQTALDHSVQHMGCAASVKEKQGRGGQEWGWIMVAIIGRDERRRKRKTRGKELAGMRSGTGGEEGGRT